MLRFRFDGRSNVIFFNRLALDAAATVIEFHQTQNN